MLDIIHYVRQVDYVIWLLLLLLLLAAVVVVVMMVVLLGRSAIYSLPAIAATNGYSTSLWYLSTNILDIWQIIDAWHALQIANELLEVLAVYRYLLPIIVVILLLGCALARASSVSSLIMRYCCALTPSLMMLSNILLLSWIQELLVLALAYSSTLVHLLWLAAMALVMLLLSTIYMLLITWIGLDVV